MKAAVCTRYRPPDMKEIQEVSKPVYGESEILVKKRATSVNSGDVKARALN